MWMKRWSNSTNRAGHAPIPDSRRPDIRIGRARSESGAAREQAVIGEVVEGFS